MYQYIFFDLDGTLTDPKEGITKSVQYALSRMGIEEPDLKKLERFIGPPLKESFEEYYGFTSEMAKEGIGYYREVFQTEGLYQNELLPGVPQMLGALKEAGKILCIASSKPEPFVCKILEHFHIDNYFENVCGSNLDETRTKKAEVIEELLKRLRISGEERSKVLMVGDRKHDVEGAAVFGIPCVGLSMGYAAEGELEKAGAVAVVDSMEELKTFILKEQGENIHA